MKKLNNFIIGLIISSGLVMSILYTHQYQQIKRWQETANKAVNLAERFQNDKFDCIESLMANNEKIKDEIKRMEDENILLKK